MKTVILLLSIIMWAKISYCQKHEIDASTISNWPIIEGELISNNGEYIYYTIINKERSKSKLIINSTKGQFYREFEGEIRAFFTQDSRYVVFIKREDTLCLINLAGGNDIYIPDVSSFNLPDGGTGQWLSYITKDAELHIYDLKAGKKEEYQHVKNYQFSKSGNALLIDYTSKEDNIRKRYLKWVDLLNKRSFLIRSGYDVVAFSNYSFGYDEQELAFISQDTIRNKISNSIWYYHLGMDSARLCVSDYNKTHEEGFEVKNSEILFSQNGDKIMFKLSHVQQVKKPNKNLANVDIWNYKDEFPQDKQLKDVVYEQNRDFVVVYNLNSGKLFRLEKECDGQWGRGYINLSYNSEYFITQNIVSFSEAYRLPKERPDIYLTNTTDGLREQIAKEVFTAG
ncbi:MAG TPA: hypothetical protein VKR58_09530, partial [Aquella sp.]|nr:hypothetical protein [Aquella sp.]